MKKEYRIEITRSGKTREVKGTVDALTKYFGYTLEVGKSWEHEKGNHKINLSPKTGKSLVANLNYAASNRAANGVASESYALL